MLTNRRLRVVEIALIVVGICAVLSVAIGLTGPLRILLVGPALLLLPGAAIVTRMDVGSLSAQIGLSLALSLAVSTTAIMLLMAVNWFEPLAVASLLAAVSLVVLALDVRRHAVVSNRSERF